MLGLDLITVYLITVHLILEKINLIADKNSVRDIILNNLICIQCRQQ